MDVASQSHESQTLLPWCTVLEKMYLRSKLSSQRIALDKQSISSKNGLEVYFTRKGPTIA